MCRALLEPERQVFASGQSWVITRDTTNFSACQTVAMVVTMDKRKWLYEKTLHFDGLVSWEDSKSIQCAVSVKWQLWLLTHKEVNGLVSWEDVKSIRSVVDVRLMER